MSHGVSLDRVSFSEVLVRNIDIFEAFVCRVSNRHGGDMMMLNISTVFVNIVLSNVTTVYACIGENATLHCISEGSLFQILWYFKKNLLSNESSDYLLLDAEGMLSIPLVQKHHFGKYTCQARNLLGVASKEIWLSRVYVSGDLTNASAPEIIKLRTSYEVLDGSSVNLSCVATGSPEPAVMWIRNGLILYPTYSDDSSTDDSSSSGILKLFNVSRKDAGLYECLARNYYGVDSGYTNLSVLHSLLTVTSVMTSHAISVSIFHTPISSIVPTAGTVPSDDAILYFVAAVYASLILSTLCMAIFIALYMRCTRC